MSVVTFVLFLLGFVLLIGGAELLVRGAARLAVSIGMSPLIVGLTVVAFGTSAPELAVTVSSSLEGESELAIGNVFGSNISNILLILGISALVAALVVDSRLIRRDVPVMIGATVVVLLMAADGAISRIDGVILLLGVVTYTGWLVLAGRSSASDDYERELGSERRTGRWPANVGLMVGGLGGLVLGAIWLVDGAVELAESLGLSELVIGLTVVAIGTSLPELATSIVATIRGERDIVAGNVVGSNILNLLLVLGAGAVVSADGLPAPDEALRLDGPVMLAASIACLPVFYSYGGIQRWEGAVFVVWYAVYVTYLILEATDAAGTELIVAATFFALPLTVLTFVVMAVRARRAGQTAFTLDGS